MMATIIVISILGFIAGFVFCSCFSIAGRSDDRKRYLEIIEHLKNHIRMLYFYLDEACIDYEKMKGIEDDYRRIFTDSGC